VVYDMAGASREQSVSSSVGDELASGGGSRAWQWQILFLAVVHTRLEPSFLDLNGILRRGEPSICQAYCPPCHYLTRVMNPHSLSRNGLLCRVPPNICYKHEA